MYACENVRTVPVNAEKRNNPKGSTMVPNTVRPFGSFPLLSFTVLKVVLAPAPNIFPTSSNNSFCKGLSCLGSKDMSATRRSTSWMAACSIRSTREIDRPPCPNVS